MLQPIERAEKEQKLGPILVGDQKYLELEEPTYNNGPQPDSKKWDSSSILQLNSSTSSHMYVTTYWALKGKG
jgi:hypothetical protein